MTYSIDKKILISIFKDEESFWNVME